MDALGQFVDSLRTIIRLMVDAPDAVSVTLEADYEGKQMIVISIAPGEAGKLIGAKGRTAQALRTILNAVAAQNGLRVGIYIAQTTDSGRHRLDH